MFDPQILRDIQFSDFASRGVSYWLDVSGPQRTACRGRIFVASADAQLHAIDATDGRPCQEFGRKGRADLKAGLRMRAFAPWIYTVTSPPLVMNGLVVVGSSIGDNNRPIPASGEVRAYDARSGALKWTWEFRGS